MSRKAGFRAGVIGVVLTVVLAGVAAASSPAPRLLSPNGKSVNPGAIKVTVDIPLSPAKHGVFIAIQPNRKTKHGRLSGTCNKRCDFVAPKHLKGHKWAYTAKYNFPGYWAVTPGKYYWQVHYYTKGDTAVYYSKVGSFTVK
jgi:hypothetical protein